MDLERKVSDFPAKPGVYMMKDPGGRVLYVGKAKSLRTRVRNYLREAGDGRPSVKFLMARTADVDFMVTDTEKEALILENVLIKKHRPKYNVHLRDDKTYLCLRLDVKAAFPRLTMTRRIKRDSALYFGPYSSARDLRHTLNLIHKIFPLRHCSESDFKNRSRPCLYCQTRGCKAPCCDLFSKEEYGRLVDQVVRFLRGDSGELVKELTREMESAAAGMEFEEAALLRDRIRAIETTLERQKTVSLKQEDRDIIALVREGGEAEVVVLVVRSGSLIDRRSYYLTSLYEDDGPVLAEFVHRYYRENRIVPREVVLGSDPGDDEIVLLEAWLADKRGTRVKVSFPRRGEKLKLVEMARKNGEELLAERRKAKVGHEAALEEIQRKLSLPSPPGRIECFDISTFQGKQPVGSMAVLTDGFADPSAYRRFVVKNVAGQDDFAMLREVLKRRFLKSGEGWQHPDLLLVDGGKGQLAMGVAVLEELGMDHIPIAGIAKSRVKEGGVESPERSEERIFLPNRKNPATFHRNSTGLFLIMRVRDEAHRLAITHHRKRAKKAIFGSELDSIPTVGPGRKKILLKHFGSLKRIRGASLDELRAVKGLPESTAKAVYVYFNG